MTGHCFVVPAYGHSPHLRECLASLRAQTRPARIVLASSTPFRGIEEVAAEYGARLVVHGPNRGIGADWNAALDAAEAPWVTVAHQDDVYLPDFSAKVMQAVSAHPGASLVVTDYRELLDDAPQSPSAMLRIKKVLLEVGFLGRGCVHHTGAKMRMLRFGCPLPCPAVTLGPGASSLRFNESLKVNLDWDAWVRQAAREGGFCYVREALMLHRIHAGSETSAGIRGGVRAMEDRQMFAALWPSPFARLLSLMYALSYRYGKT